MADNEHSSLNLQFDEQEGKRVLPLNKENVESVFKTGALTRGTHVTFGDWLDIPKDRCHNPLAAADWWMNNGKDKSWRYITYFLDRIGETGVATELMPYCEPPSDSSLTVDKAKRVFVALKKWESSDEFTCGGCILVPASRSDNVRKQHTEYDDQKKEAAEYYVKYFPFASLGHLARCLYRAGEQNAMVAFKEEFPETKDPTITQENVESLTKDVEMDVTPSVFEDYLDMPGPLYGEITKNHGMVEKRRQAVFSEFLSHHPYPRWELIIQLIEKLEGKGKARAGLAQEVKDRCRKLSRDSGELGRSEVRPREKMEYVLSKALEGGSFKERSLISTLLGLMGAGKTTLICRLFGIEPPAAYTSTGVAEKAMRGLLHLIMKIGSWELLSYIKILQFLASLLLADIPEADMARSFIWMEIPDPSSSLSEDPVQPTQPPTPTISPSSTSPPVTPASRPQVKKSHTTEAMVDLLQSSSVSKEDTVLELLHVVDTGGQTEFLETMPSMLHNSHVVVLVLNLAQSLDAFSQTIYHEDGRAFEHRFASTLTNRQLILAAARTMEAKRSICKGGQRSKMIVVGTHRDMLSSPTAIAAVNRELNSILLPMFEEELFVYRSTDEILFPVNSLTPNRDDEMVFEEIRKRISDPNLGEVISTPLSYFMFEQDTIKYAEQEGRKMLSFDECVEVGSQLKMGREVVLAALLYLHQHNIFLYFPNVLPELVFTDPQAPLDFVNTIVAFSYKALAGVFPGLPAEYVTLLMNAIVTEEMFQIESLSTLFIPNLYQPQHAIALFTHLCVIAPLSYGKPQSKGRQSRDTEQPTLKASSPSNQKYLMPCLLKDLTDIGRFLPQSSVAVFVVHFIRNCVPNGTFVGSITRLLSAHGWEVCRKEDGTPQCLAHNIVSIHDPTMPAQVTYVNTTRHFELHVSCLDSEEYASIFPLIRNTIFDAIHHTFTVMRFKDVTIQNAFLCTFCSSKSKRHAATLHHHERSSFLKCTLNGSVSKVNDSHQIWIQAVPSAPQETTTCTASEPPPHPQPPTPAPGSCPDLIELIRFRGRERRINIPQEVGTHYQQFGILLLNDPTGSRVRNITHKCRGEPEAINMKILRQWLEGKGRPVTWDTLVQTLEDIGLRTLAKDIRDVKL